MTTWIISDTHFGHKNIIKYCHRPFNSVDEMNEKLVENWNTNVKPDDKVYHLGDFAFKRHRHIFYKLNGYKHLIKGNHDSEETFRLDWIDVHDYLELTKIVDGKAHTFILFHYPIVSWDGCHKNRKIHLFGHIHNNETGLPANYKGINCSVELWNYSPISLSEIVEKHRRLIR